MAADLLPLPDRIDVYKRQQFAYACKQLGVELGSSSVPQAKGRVERLNQTLQSRLPVELRLAGITTIDAANAVSYTHLLPHSGQWYRRDSSQILHLPLSGN